MRVKISPSVIGGTISAPPSKSYTHRAIILGSLAKGETVIDNYLASDDTTHTINVCRALGVDIHGGNKRLEITGTGGQFPNQTGPIKVFVGNSGSTIRMMAAVAALAPGITIFDGDKRLRERPVGDLISALQSLGVKVRSLERDGYPPIEIVGGRIEGGEVSASGRESSQHISSLIMVAPYADSPVTVKLIDQLHSSPYVDITIDAMRQFGIEVENNFFKKFVVKNNQRYTGRYYRVEGDYSSAAYFFAAAAIGKGFMIINNLEANSVQGDRYFLEILSRMGCQVNYDGGQVRVTRRDELIGVTMDMGDCPDIAQPLAIVAAYAKGKTKITNIGHLRLKESDRIADTVLELRKMGIEVEVAEDAMTVTGGRPKGATIDSHNDHRMTMSFAIAALFAEGETVINGAESVAKSYPSFFEDFKSLGAKVEEI